MNKKVIFISLIIVVLSTIGFLVTDYFIDENYRKQIPQLPGLTSASDNLKAQIISAHNKALDKTNADNLGHLGMVYYSSNYYVRAVACFKLAAKKGNNDWVWYYYLGQIQSELGEGKESAINYKKVVEIKPQANLAWYRLAEVYQQTGDVKSAEKILLDLLKKKQRDFNIRPKYRLSYYTLPVHIKMLLSRIYMGSGKYDMAEKQLIDVIEKNKTLGQAYKQMGVLYNRTGDEIRAKKYTIRSNDLVLYNFPVDTLMDKITLMSRSSGYLLKQIDIATSGKDSRWSVEIINTSLKNITDDKFIIDKAINQYLFMGLGKYALPYLNKHLELFKDSWQELQKVGVKLAEAGYKKEALRYFDRIRELSDLSPVEKSILAGLYFEKLGLKDKAINYTLEILDQYENHKTVLGDAVFLFLNSGDYTLADKYFAILKLVDPSSPRISLLEGIKAEQQGDIKATKRLYQKSFNNNSDSPYIISRLGGIYEKDAEWSKAVDFYKKAIEESPNNSYLQERLGSILITIPDEQIQDLQNGMEYAERAFYNSKYTSSTKISAARSLAIGYYQLGNKSSSEYYINKAIGLADKSKFPPDYIRGLVNLSKQLQ